MSKVFLKLMSVSIMLGVFHTAVTGVFAATSTVVFHALVEGEPFYRAPQMVVANDGSLLVFAENRGTIHDPGRGPGLISVVMKRSTDMGATWSPMQVLQSGALHDFSGVAPVVDTSTGEVILSYSRTPNEFIGGVVPTGTGSNTFNTVIHRSTDNGVTWLPASLITSQVKDPSSTVFAPSPVSGIQLRWQADPSRNGRLIIPAFQSDGVEARARVILNDANGLDTAWQVGALTPSTGVSVTEADIVELVNGDLWMDARPNNNLLPRQRFTSTDGGSTWSLPVPSDILDASVDVGLARYTAKRDGDDRNRLVYSSPLGSPLGAANGRVNLGVWTSYDEGKTFINPVQIGTEADGYSNLQKLPDGRLGLTYETTEIGGGTAQFDIDRIMFVNMGLSDLEGQTHQRELTHYDGFGNQIDRLRGGMGWSGSWNGSATVVEAGQLNYTGFKFPTEQGRTDLVNGQAIERELATPIDLNSNSTTYLSMLISQDNDNSQNAGNEFLDIRLKDTQGNAQAIFGVGSDESFVVSSLGGGAGTAPGLLDRSSTYFLVAKIVSQDDQVGGNFDQIFLKVFRSGVDAISDTEGMFSWTVVGGTGENSGALIDQIEIASGLEVTWSIDEIRVGTTYGSVASNVSATLDGDLDGDGFVGIADLNLVLGNWNLNVPPGDPPADPSGDGFVGIEDLNVVLGNWNAGTPPADGAVIPEPASLALLGMGCAAVLRRRS